MDQATHNKIVSFIWGIADDVLRDLFKRGKYPDVILPMCVLRRLDAVLEPTKQAVLERKMQLDAAGIAHQDGALMAAAGQAFYNTSLFTLRDLTSRATQQALKQDFLAYLDGFSQNVQDILTNFKFRNQIDTLSADDALAPLISKFLDPSINLSPEPVRNTDGSLRHPPTDNHAMGTIFEELVRRFNAENNEEAGEHWTPRDAVRLMADLVFEPVKDALKPGAYTIYDGACGTGGMLTLAEERLRGIAKDRDIQVRTMLYGQEINPETYAVCKADMILKGEGHEAEHIKGGAGWSTLSNDAYPAKTFDFMLSNPPYGKSWKKDFELMGGKGNISDPRFTVKLEGEDEPVSLVTRTSDGQMLFLVNMLSKMADSKLGSRIAHVHNGSSLFTGDAGQGESNVRRWIMENDWLEAIIALPLNMFYNTGIATYVWVLSNRKPAHSRGKVQLIDASAWSTPLQKNLGQKNCKLSDEDIRRIVDTFLAFESGPKSKIFRNQEFGYWKVTVERPLRLVTRFTVPEIEALRFQSGDVDVREAMFDRFGQALFGDFAAVRRDAAAFLAEWAEDDEDEEEAPSRRKLTDKKKEKLLNAATWERDARLYAAGLTLRHALGTEEFRDYNQLDRLAQAALSTARLVLTPAERKIVLRACSKRCDDAPSIIAKVHKKAARPDPYRGLHEVELDGKRAVVSYEPDPELRDTEQVPLLEPGGVEAFFDREVRPYAVDAWVEEGKTKVGYEISFTRHFYEPKPLRGLTEIVADIAAAERQAKGLLENVLGMAA